jgi:hypothetical protein
MSFDSAALEAEPSAHARKLRVIDRRLWRSDWILPCRFDRV